MAKIGDSDYPAQIGPEEAREAIEILVNEFGGEAGSEEAFAQAIGHSTTTSGSYLRKRGDIRKYGLMKPRSIEATEFGFEAANPRNEEHKHEILFNMLKNISLLSEIYESVNGTKPDEMWRVLTEITDANPKEAQEAEDKIESLYLKMLEYESSEDKHEEEELEEEGDNEPTSREARFEKEESDIAVSASDASTAIGKPETGIFVKVGNDEIKLEDITDSNIDLAKQFLESKKGMKSEAVQMRFK